MAPTDQVDPAVCWYTGFEFRVTQLALEGRQARGMSEEKMRVGLAVGATLCLCDVAVDCSWWHGTHPDVLPGLISDAIEEGKLHPVLATDSVPAAPAVWGEEARSGSTNCTVRC